MQKDHSNIISSEALVNYFKGRATQVERATILSWANESEENTQLLTELRIVWIDTGALKIDTDNQVFDSRPAWEKLEKIPRQSSDGFPYLSKKRIAIAASIVLVFCSLFVFLKDTTQEKMTIAKSEPVEQLLPDSSLIVLNKNSSLIYLKEFAQHERRVKLLGQAFFEITGDKKKPFIIEANTTIVQVVGTSFDVKIDEDKVTVLVVSGEVIFGKDSKMLSLKPGEKGIFHTDSQEMEYFTKVSDIGTEQFWRTQKLTFSGQSLPVIARTLEKVFDTQIILQDDALSACRLSVTFENDTLENTIEIIAATLGLEITYSSNAITLSGTGCQQE